MTTPARHAPEQALCREDHKYGPATRIAWQAWAADLAKTHRQSDCPDCGLPVIWRPHDELGDDAQLDLFGSET